ncbi:MAG: hypothetical protein MUP55_00750 [Candidatus Aenigmarchaeota archaeon]|nr:hypothetical protein [Candidatus Aenigmarchaeota archaeon]
MDEPSLKTIRTAIEAEHIIETEDNGDEVHYFDIEDKLYILEVPVGFSAKERAHEVRLASQQEIRAWNKFLEKVGAKAPSVMYV